MKTRVCRIDPSEEIPPGLLEDLTGLLLSGGVIVYPTETFYGLGAAALSKKGVRAVFRIKRRDASKPLSVMAADLDMVDRITSGAPPVLRVLAGEFWPGPLTVVLPAAPEIPSFLKSRAGSVAVRIPPDAWIRKLVRSISQPLTATSANLSGEREVSDPAEALSLFGGKVDLVVDGGETPGGSPTTLVDLTRETPAVIREGTIPASAVLAVLQPGSGRI